MDDIEKQIVERENQKDKISLDVYDKKEELKKASGELEQIKAKNELAISETEQLITARNIAEKAMQDASMRAASYQSEIANLEGTKWTLPEPGALTSAKSFFKDVALPLVQSLKDWIKTLISQVKVLEGKVKELTDYKKWAEVKIKSQARENLKRQEEFDTLMKDLEEYNLLKIAFGPERMYNLLIEAMDMYEQRNGVPYYSLQSQEKDYKR